MSRPSAPAVHEEDRIHDAAPRDPPAREWLLTNGLGGYAAGTVEGIATRRYHGLLIGAYPPPLGRVMLLAGVEERLTLPDGRTILLGGAHPASMHDRPAPAGDHEFVLHDGLPVWRYTVGPAVLEKRIVLVHGENRTVLGYRLVHGSRPLGLAIDPLIDLRSHDAPVGTPLHPATYAAHREEHGITIRREGYEPVVRIGVPSEARVTLAPRVLGDRYYATEAERGYASMGAVWSPGRLTMELPPGGVVSVVVDDGAPYTPLDVVTAQAHEQERRDRLLVAAGGWARQAPATRLVHAADAFLIAPRRPSASASARTIVAGYHWFTDWGRDTMISLEGLTLTTGRFAEARDILRMFGGHVRRGLIPNLFPEGDTEGLYHTADATLWFVHALSRYEAWTGDASLVDELLPTMRDIVVRHIEGTDFGIGIDTADGLLRQGAEGYQLTWMDAKVDDWVVTPRRGKAVEINALWYNALRVLQAWEARCGHGAAAETLGARADATAASFNRRFWMPDAEYLYDVVDGEQGNDPAFRPNQLFAIALPHPVLDRSRWEPVVRQTHERLFTPVGLRSLEPDHQDYRPWYFGELRARDAAYHQGTVWGWLIGPFIDAWLRVHPADRAGARRRLAGLLDDLESRACLGSISEIYDAEPPHIPRGCVAQAWSVAETLRCWHRIEASRGE